MSAYQTIKITKSVAKKFILTKILEAENDKLERILDIFIEKRLYYSKIVCDDEENDNYLLE